ncbi:hypothetical protein ACFXAF_33705 [Kitasatospora sp. NPDC059463]|uniref:hypothetical protein n=1 Tax=unclassified Kitasatospora TaxID=2633591 RepID=UPI0036C9D9BC
MPGSTDLGTRLVWAELQVVRPQDLPGRGTATLHGAVADQIVTAASTLDHVQSRIVELATSLGRDLQRISAGQDADFPVTNGILRATSLDIDLLVTRRTELHRSLTGLVAVYQELPAFTPPVDPTPARAKATARHATSAQTSKAALPARQKQALQSIGDGGVTIYRGLASGRLRIVAPGTLAVATVNELIDQKLVESYPAQGLQEGRMLALTPAGQARYEELRAADGRAAAARTRPAGTVGEAPLPLAGASVAVSAPRSRARG